MALRRKDSADCTCIPRGSRLERARNHEPAASFQEFWICPLKANNTLLKRLLNQATLGHTSARTADQGKGAAQHAMCAIGDKCKPETRDLII